MKILLEKQTGKKFLFKEGEDFHTKWGHVKKEDYNSDSAKSSMGKDFFILDPTFIDLYRKIKRKAQLVPLETLGRIAIETGINKNSIIVDAGTGSGGACIFFANICKEVYTYDIEETHTEISKDNAKFVGLKNIKFNRGDITESGFNGVKDSSVDLVFLDFVTPWKMLDEVYRVLKRGGSLVVYNPQITQIVELRKFYDDLNNEKDHFISFKVIEIIERLWKVEDKIARPRFSSIGHSGFVSFMRKV